MPTLDDNNPVACYTFEQLQSFIESLPDLDSDKIIKLLRDIREDVRNIVLEHKDWDSGEVIRELLRRRVFNCITRRHGLRSKAQYVIGMEIPDQVYHCRVAEVVTKELKKDERGRLVTQPQIKKFPEN